MISIRDHILDLGNRIAGELAQLPWTNVILNSQTGEVVDPKRLVSDKFKKMMEHISELLTRRHLRERDLLELLLVGKLLPW